MSFIHWRFIRKKRLWHCLVFLLLCISVSQFSNAQAPLITQSLGKIDQNSQKFSFAIFGDNRSATAVFEELVAQINQDKPDFAVSLGDMVQEGRQALYDVFLQQLARLNAPLISVIGNHELRLNGLSLYQQLFGPPYYSFKVGHSYFIVLDNANQKNLDLPQMKWLTGELEKSQAFRQRFVLMHVPLYDPRSGAKGLGHSMADLSFAKELNDLFDQHQVTMVFASHVHGYYQGKWQQTPFIISGGAGAHLHGRDTKHFFYHYLLISVNNDEVTYQIRRLDPR